METKAITNNFSKGMTNIPSDAICPDDTTSAEYNLIFKDGEHKPIQAPVNAFEGQSEGMRKNMQLIYVHNYNNVKRCIFYNDNNNYLYWAFWDNVNSLVVLLNSFEIKIDEINGITSIGNTLIISLSTEGHKSLHYFLWKPDLNNNNGNYSFIGTKLPDPVMNIYLTSAKWGKMPFEESEVAKYGDMINFTDTGDGYYTMKAPTGKEEDMKALLIGLYSKCKNSIYKQGGFCLPFFVRYAIKLFDGTYTHISVPQLMFACVRRNVAFFRLDGEIKAVVQASTIIFKQTFDFTDWSDIIKGVSIFVTNPVEVNDTSTVSSTTVTDILCDAVTTKTKIYADGDVNSPEPTKYVTASPGTINNSFKMLSDAQIISELIKSSVFYKIVDIDTKPMPFYEPINKYMGVNDLINLTTLEQLDHDDYYSRCPFTSDNIFMYNKRLHLANLTRGFYKGHSDYTHFDYDSKLRQITPYIKIKTPSGDMTIKGDTYITRDVWSLYYYYPDPRAYQVTLVDSYYSTKTAITLDLKSHPLLNGAYYLEKLPTANSNLGDGGSVITTLPVENEKYEELQNQIWVSEVNNPFVFNASGVNTVGNGSILGTISNTTALSQGQFGQFPLICFTTDGIYALEVASTGVYSSAHPISREVCNNTKSIVATDHLVFFSSEKGLMMINGSQVTCVSENLSGKIFFQSPQEYEVMVSNDIDTIPSLIDFLREAFIAYDYRDNMLWIMNPNHRLCYILSIDSGAYAFTTMPYNPLNIVNDYPDSLIETDANQTFKTFSLINRPNINDDPRRIFGFIFSRPMKLGDSLALKNLTDIRLIENLNPRGRYRERIFVSDDMRNWSRNYSKRGRGFKYFKYNLIFENMLPTDTISGIVSRWQYRYPNKLR